MDKQGLVMIEQDKNRSADQAETTPVSNETTSSGTGTQGTTDVASTDGATDDDQDDD